MPLSSHALPVLPTTDPATATGTFVYADRPLGWPKSLKWVPNFQDWKAGDILVFEGLGDLPSTIIEHFQQATAPPGAAPCYDCTHAAVYIGEGLIADARFRRLIGVRRLWPETQRRKLGVFRLDDAKATSAEVRLFVEEVLALEDVPYGSSPKAFISWLNGTFLKQAPRGLVCSALVEYAANNAGIALAMARRSYGPMLPASLATHPWLIPVPAEWRVAR